MLAGKSHDGMGVNLGTTTIWSTPSTATTGVSFPAIPDIEAIGAKGATIWSLVFDAISDCIEVTKGYARREFASGFTKTSN
jgi:hypothetical protein